jgi:hypothetical protein
MNQLVLHDSFVADDATYFITQGRGENILKINHSTNVGSDQDCLDCTRAFQGGMRSDLHCTLRLCQMITKFERGAQKMSHKVT